jgi:uncharacterized protein (AIM24 family)
MSKIALASNASGTGTLTLAAPNTNSDRTIDLPDAAGTVFVSGQALSATTGSFSGNVTLGSSVLATPSGSAPSYTCRAWVNFDGTGTVAIRASGNVSSITDNGNGLYQVNLTTAMPDTNYAVAGQAIRNVAYPSIFGTYASAKTTTSFSFNTTENPSVGWGPDCNAVDVVVFR